MPVAAPGAPVLAPLAHRNFRLLWLGTFVSHTGDWMDTVALGWLAVARGVPILLFTLVGGAVADRLDRRRLSSSPRRSRWRWRRWRYRSARRRRG